MSVDVTIGSSPLNVPLLNTGAVPGFLDTTLLGVLRTPTTSTTTAGTTAGSIIDYEIVNFEGSCKTDIIDVSGYENDTTTAQSITFKTAYSSFNFITANTSGLTITLSLTGLTITAPDVTTIFNGGIMITGV